MKPKSTDRVGSLPATQPSSPPHNEPTNGSRPLAVGVIGCGYWGPNLARNFNALGSCKLAAVCDSSPDRLEHMHGLYPEAQGFEDVDALLVGNTVDAVVVATPVRFHHSVAKRALLAGKHVLIEKPMASSAEECEELIAIAERLGLVLMVGHTFLYSEPVQRIDQIIRSGEIGDLRYISCQRLNLGIFQKDINVAWDLAPHDISIILHLMRETPEVINCQGNDHLTPGLEDVTNMSLGFSGHRFATIQSSWMEPRKVRQMTIVGTKRMIVYDDVEPLEKLKIFEVRVDRPPHYDSFAGFHYSYHYGDSYIPRLEQSEPLREQCGHFVDCIAEGRSPITGGEHGLQLVRILEASSASLRLNGAPVQMRHGVMDLQHLGGSTSSPAVFAA